MINTTKACSRCKELKPLDSFHKNKKSKDGFNYTCKTCCKENNQKNYENNKEQLCLNQKNYYHNNKENHKTYRDNNKEKIKLKEKIYRDKHKQNHKDYIIKNKQHLNNKVNKYLKNKRNQNSIFRLVHNTRCLIIGSLKSKGFKKQSKTENILGCSFEEFKQHIESQFEPWMNWENMGGRSTTLPNISWDIDHIIPLKVAKSEEEVIKLNHYTNLRPLCSYENRFVKKDKYE